MNLKKAKFLRRLAADVASEMDEVAPKGSMLQHQQRGFVVNDPRSLRGIYRRIKKEVT